MKPEDKDLLLKDLCARLPYEVRIGYKEHNYDFTKYWLRSVDPESDRPVTIYFSERVGCGSHSGFRVISLDEAKPYLRPMSSMTEEEREQYNSLCDLCAFYDELGRWTNVYYDTVKSFDFLLANHFDFIGLIPMGAAIKVTEENNPYKD